VQLTHDLNATFLLPISRPRFDLVPDVSRISPGFSRSVQEKLREFREKSGKSLGSDQNKVRRWSGRFGQIGV
jgi:hypothetical protein